MDLYIRPSQINNAGLGAFTKTKLKSNRIIGKYMGDCLTLTEFDLAYPNNKNGNYVLQISKNKYIDATNPVTSNYTRFINDPRNTKFRANVIFTPNGNLKTITRIKKNEELFVDYGPEYVF